MKKSGFLFLLIIQLNLQAQPVLELFSGLETAGINVYLDPLSDVEGDAQGFVKYRLSGAADWKDGVPLTNVSEKSRLSGSLFWLQPGLFYEVQVELKDATTPALDQTLMGTFKTRSEVDFTPAAIRLVVSPNGTGNTCTDGQPCSLSTALLMVEAGQDIELEGGTYFVGGLNLAKSGTSLAPITIRSKTGTQAILDGSDPAPYVWFPGQGTPGTFYTQLKEANANVNCVVIDGVRMYPYAKLFPDLVNFSLSCILGQPVPIGISGMTRDPRPNTIIPFQIPNPYYKLLFVHLKDGSDPNDHEVAISLQSSCLSIANQSYIRFQNLKFQNYGVAPSRRTITLNHCNEIVFDHCHFEHNDINILVQGNTNQLSVQFCYFKDDTDWNTFIGKATYEPQTPFLCYGQTPDPFPYGDRVAETGAIFFDFDFNGRGTMIRGNTFTGFMDGTKASASPNAVTDVSYTQECDVFDNLIDGGDDGIELEGVAGNLRFFRNTLRDCGAAISLAPVLYGPVFLLRNTISDFHESLFTFTGSATLGFSPGTPMKFQSGFGLKIGKVYAFHNTICVKGTGRAYGLEVFSAGAAMAGFVGRNNIFFAEKNVALALRNDTQIPKVDLDYNNYICADTLVQVQLNSGIQYFNNLPDFTTAFGLEAHGLNVDPAFLDTATNNFHLKTGSPCVDAGLIIPGINDQWFLGNAPDMGAFETAALGIGSVVLEAHFRLYPNPATHQISFELFSDESQIVHLDFYDLTGRQLSGIDKVLTGGKNVITIPLDHWGGGVYLVTANFKDHILHGRFVKENSRQ